MPKIIYYILLSNEGDFLVSFGSRSWGSTLKPNLKTTFDTYEEATFYLNSLSIRSIWPDAKVHSILTK